VELRGAALGPKGYKEKGKRKLEAMEELHARMRSGSSETKVTAAQLQGARRAVCRAHA